MQNELIENCGMARALPIFKDGNGKDLVFVNAVTSTQRWASIMVTFHDNFYEMGWDGQRLSWVEDTRRLYSDCRRCYSSLVDALTDNSPTDLVFRGLDAYHAQPKAEPLNTPLDPGDCNTVVDLSVMLRPFPLFVRVRSLQTPKIEMVSLVPGIAKKWARRDFFVTDNPIRSHDHISVANSHQMALIMELRNTVQPAEIRAVAIGAPWMDLKTIADQPND